MPIPDSSDIRCEACGYDKAGLPSRSCPECGYAPLAEPRIRWQRWPVVLRPVWLAASPFVCKAMSLVGEALVDRAAPVGLVAVLLACAAVLLVPVDIAITWQKLHGEPMSFRLRVVDVLLVSLSILAVLGCVCMLAWPA